MSSPTAPTFTVTRTNKAASKKRLLVADRSDLPTAMSRQRCNALNFSRGKLQEALMSDYTTTLTTRGIHHEFLAMILNEVHQHHKTTFGVVLPLRALEIVAERIATDMQNDDDHYAHCLNFLSRYRLYSTGFQETAARLVASEKQQKKDLSSSSVSSSSSCGLSDDGY